MSDHTHAYTHTHTHTPGTNPGQIHTHYTRAHPQIHQSGLKTETPVVAFVAVSLLAIDAVYSAPSNVQFTAL
jgi:hypothetical protein